MATIMQDEIMVNNLKDDENRKNAPINSGEVDILEAIINEGMSEDTDNLIKNIHNIQRTGLKHENFNIM